jgi:hypothetical protein
VGAKYFAGVTLPAAVVRIHFPLWSSYGALGEVSIHQPYFRILRESLRVRRGDANASDVLAKMREDAASAVAFAIRSGFSAVTVGSNLLNGAGARKKLIERVLLKNPWLRHELSSAPISTPTRMLLSQLVKRKREFQTHETFIRFERQAAISSFGGRACQSPDIC